MHDRPVPPALLLHRTCPVVGFRKTIKFPEMKATVLASSTWRFFLSRQS